jgi:hypothetical protein
MDINDTSPDQTLPSAALPPHVWSRDEINDLLDRNPRAVERGIIRLYIRQEATERSQGQTVKQNGIGFNAFWASSGTYYARWLLSGKRLSGGHLEKARKCCKVHSAQLTAYANGEITPLEAAWEAAHPTP